MATGEAASAQWQHVLDNLIGQRQKGVMVIDDAHLMPYSLLSALVEVVQSQAGAVQLQCVFAGKPSLHEKLQSLVEGELPTIRFGMLSRQQITSRVQAYLSDQGMTAGRPTIERVVTHIYARCQGESERLDALLRRLTLHDFMTPKMKSSAVSGAASVTSWPHWRQQGVQHTARLVALVGRCATIVFLYWREQNPPRLSPPLPTRPFHYKLVEPRPAPASKQTSAAKPEPTSKPIPISKNQLKPAHVPMPPKYTIQLMGSFNRQDVAHFLSTHQLQLPHGQIFEQTYHDRPWFVLGVGQYPSKASAHAALNNLPPSLQQRGAWVRAIH